MKARYRSLQALLRWEQGQRPINWHQQFGRQAPLDIEIGFGNGEFLTQQAQAHPERDFIGLELEWPSVQRGLRHVTQAQVSNVRFLMVDARVALERLVLPGTVHRIYSLFPCPWPKERHAKYRLFATSFLCLANSRLIETGEVQVVTDAQPYLQWILEQFPDTGFSAQWTPVPTHFRSKYARKWASTGQQEFYELRLAKVAHKTIALTEDVPLQNRRVQHFDAERFRPEDVRGTIHVACKEFLYDPVRRKGLLWVFVTEEAFEQDFWIEIARRDHDWVIRPARGCGIIPTLGVQRALDLVRDAAQQTTP